MQWAYIAITCAGGILSTGIAFGLLKAQLNQHRKELDKMKDEISLVAQLYVTFRHFEAVISPMQAQANEMAKDIKEILSYVKR